MSEVRSRPVSWVRFWPQGLAGRFALLLVGALVAVNLVAAALLSSDPQRLGRELHERRAIDRLLSLVPLMEAVPPSERDRIAGLASDRFARISVGGRPIIDETEMDDGSTALARQMLAALGSGPDDLRVGIVVGPRHGEAGEEQGPPRGGQIALSIPLVSPEEAQAEGAR
jgi:hypothetical protein